MEPVKPKSQPDIIPIQPQPIGTDGVHAAPKTAAPENAPHPYNVPTHHTLNDQPIDPVHRTAPKKDHEGLKSFLSTLAILIIAPIVALMLTAFVFQSYEVDGPSMETTLQNRDRLIVLKIPKTIAAITGHTYIPNRGDVIVFTRHESESGIGSERQLIKRVIGLPGDRVVVKDNKVMVYNTEHPDGFEPDRTYSYGSVITTTSGDIDVTVPDKEVFVCGDNRGNSLDSRSFGTVKSSDIVGKLQFRVYPLSKAENF